MDASQLEESEVRKRGKGVPPSPIESALRRSVHRAASIATNLAISEMSGASEEDALRSEIARWSPDECLRAREYFRLALKILDESSEKKE